MTLFSFNAPDDRTGGRPVASLLTPWAATGTLGRRDARLFTEAAAADPGLRNDLAIARAEQAAVCEMAEALGRPSMRPMLALFAAIDRAQEPRAPNVIPLDHARVARPSGDADANAIRKAKKICRGR